MQQPRRFHQPHELGPLPVGIATFGAAREREHLIQGGRAAILGVIERTIPSCGTIPRRIAFGYSGGLAVIADESGCATFVE